MRASPREGARGSDAKKTSWTLLPLERTEEQALAGGGEHWPGPAEGRNGPGPAEGGELRESPRTRGEKGNPNHSPGQKTHPEFGRCLPIFTELRIR